MRNNAGGTYLTKESAEGVPFTKIEKASYWRTFVFILWRKFTMGVNQRRRQKRPIYRYEQKKQLD